MIKVRVPELLAERNQNATDLMRKGNIAYATALRLSKGNANAISFGVLESLCRFFKVDISQILEYIPDPSDQT